jgi:DNA-directed RNA polymerase subunit omega
VEDCLKNLDSRFTLVHLAVRRVLQPRSGAPLTMENAKGNKEVVMALREIAASKITVDNIRQIEESRPVPAEPLLTVPDPVATAELREILDEATSLSAEAGYEGADQVIDQDTEQETDRGADEEQV